MREISLVKRLKFNFTGSIAKKALVIGDADNDQLNELVCANLQGDLAIFKDCQPNKYAYANELGMVTACLVGEVLNDGRNCVAAINTEGWLFLFDLSPPPNLPPVSPLAETAESQQVGTNLDPDSPSQENIHENLIQDGEKVCSSYRLKLIYDQRMPSNCKELLIADLDGDGQNELIVGLTDRVLRTYKWTKIGEDRGKFVGLYKWEFADQIGAVSLNSSRHENCQDIIVAQPGGTYAKLECFDKKPFNVASNSSSSASSSGSDEKQLAQTSSSSVIDNHNDSTFASSSSPITKDDNVKTEYISKLTPEYHQLALAQMRNHHVSTEVLGGIRDSKDSDSYSSIVIATLDGTLMLVNKDQILWSLQVDHQLFAAALLESEPRIKNNKLSMMRLIQSESTSTIVAGSVISKHSDIQQSEDAELLSPQEAEEVLLDPNQFEQRCSDTPKSIKKFKPMSQYFVVCAWNGKTYIIDEERNYLRFKFDEAVSAFTAGVYHFDNQNYPSLVYATFNNQIVLYYDVIVDNIRPMYLVEEISKNHAHIELAEQISFLSKQLNIKCDPFTRPHIHGLEYCMDTLDIKDENDTLATNQPVENEETKSCSLRYLLREILYNLTDSELQL